MMDGGKRLLCWVQDEVNALLDVALEAGDASFDKLLLLVSHTTQDVDGLLSAIRLYEKVSLHFGERKKKSSAEE